MTNPVRTTASNLARTARFSIRGLGGCMGVAERSGRGRGRGPLEWFRRPSRRSGRSPPCGTLTTVLRESRRQLATLLSAYDSPQERTPPTWQSPLLHRRGLSCRQGSMGARDEACPTKQASSYPTAFGGRPYLRRAAAPLNGGRPSHSYAQPSK